MEVEYNFTFIQNRMIFMERRYMATIIDGSEMAFKASFVFGLPDWHALEFLSQQYI